jgi:hypothetical protein
MTSSSSDSFIALLDDDGVAFILTGRPLFLPLKEETPFLLYLSNHFFIVLWVPILNLSAVSLVERLCS